MAHYDKYQSFIYDQANTDMSEDLQSLQHHLVMLFETYKVICKARLQAFELTSKELGDMLVDLDEVEKTLKKLFKYSQSQAEDVQIYDMLVKEILKRLGNYINKIATSKKLTIDYERLKLSSSKEDVRFANDFYDQCLERFNEAQIYLEEFTVKDDYKRNLHLIGLTDL